MQNIFKIERVDDEHLIRPELICSAKLRIQKEARIQLKYCEEGGCSLSGCDESCSEASDFLEGLKNDT